MLQLSHATVGVHGATTPSCRASAPWGKAQSQPAQPTHTHTHIADPVFVERGGGRGCAGAVRGESEPGKGEEDAAAGALPTSAHLLEEDFSCKEHPPPPCELKGQAVVMGGRGNWHGQISFAAVQRKALRAPLRIHAGGTRDRLTGSGGAAPAHTHRTRPMCCNNRMRHPYANNCSWPCCGRRSCWTWWRRATSSRTMRSGRRWLLRTRRAGCQTPPTSSQPPRSLPLASPS